MDVCIKPERVEKIWRENNKEGNVREISRAIEKREIQSGR